MEFSEIASIAGKRGLYKVLKSSRSGVIVESVDEKQQRFLAGIHHRVSILSEISIYITDGEGHVPLEEVMKTIHQEFGDDPGIDGSANESELRAFLKHLLPNYDEDRVYASDIKKLVTWYGIIYENFPDLLIEKKETKKPGEKKGSEATDKDKKDSSGKSGKSTSKPSGSVKAASKSAAKSTSGASKTTSKSTKKAPKSSGSTRGKSSK